LPGKKKKEKEEEHGDSSRGLKGIKFPRSDKEDRQTSYAKEFQC